MMRYLLVALGAALGGMGRYFITGLAQQWLGASFPYGTLIVNLLGCFLVGVLMTALPSGLIISPEARSFMVVGFLGGLTTFSAFGYESDRLLRDGEMALFSVNVLANVGLGLGAVAAGRALVLALSV